MAAIIDSWAEDAENAREVSQQLPHEDPELIRQLIIAAKLVKLAQEEGMDAAILWKLTYG